MVDYLDELARRLAGAGRNGGRSQGLAELLDEEPMAEEPIGGESIEGAPSPEREPAADDAELRLRQELGSIAASGLFDAAWYLEAYPDIAGAGLDPLWHFYLQGYKEGRRPNPYFDPLWYMARNADVQASGMQPLLHYALFGDREGRSPVAFFDTGWYRETHLAPGDDQLALAHFLPRRASGTVSPHPLFDVAFYLGKYPDVKAAGCDPFEHYLHAGFREGRHPSTAFDTRYYLQKNLAGDLSLNPLVHYIETGAGAGLLPRPSEAETSIPREVKKYVQPGIDFEEFRPNPVARTAPVKVLAYYLPQFHAFPENDAWWGRGFTEWTNVARGLPRFVGHYQPRIPRDLGSYTLQGTEVMRRQVELARQAGLHGFCFYFYWFNGKRLLEKPIDAFLADRSIDFPFCLMWANENWTRRWDGAESEVLISQSYDPDDDERLVAEFMRHIADPRYIRVGGRPLLMLYRPGIIPKAAETMKRWRRVFQETYGEDPIIVMGQCFNDVDPTKYGLDGAIEFPPHKLADRTAPINMGLKYLDDDFSAHVYDYEEIARASLTEPYPLFPLIKTIVPSWDNDARRQGGGLVISGGTPRKYQDWLTGVIELAQRHKFHGEAFVCVNAWNEWAEGAYLEPDLHFGAAYLNATSRALAGIGAAGRRKVVLVGHDAFPSGAQHLLLNIGRLFARRFGVEIAFVLLDGGRMVEKYRAIGPTHLARTGEERDALVRKLAAEGFKHAVVNTSAAAAAVPALTGAGLETVQLVHELPRIMAEKGLIDGARLAAAQARAVLFATRFVADNFADTVGFDLKAKTVIRPQGLYKVVRRDPAARERLRKALGVGAKSRVVLNVGYADLRKGYDLFLQLWRQAQARRLDLHFVWVGDIDPGLQTWLRQEAADAAKSGRFHHVAFTDSIEDYFSAADLLALTSREDPFPSVVLEALSGEVPAVVFADAGGIDEVIESEAIGRVVPYCDTGAMLKAIVDLTEDPADAKRHGPARRALVERRFDFADYGAELLQRVGALDQKISVVVPNYNYARYLGDRLGTVFGQTLPLFEVIVLDDASPDASVAELERLKGELGRDFELVVNEANSGSVFAQWRRGLALAKGDLIWIAEADDLSAPQFLERLVPFFRDPEVVLAFADSEAIDPDGKQIWESYKGYYATVEKDALAADALLPAAEFLARYLAVKNLILNVSAVLWRKAALAEAMARVGEDLGKLRMAGDWRIYAEACLLTPEAKVGYSAEVLNRHRRHATSVTHALNHRKHLEEIETMHALIAGRLPADEPLAARQKSYIEEVTRQFGLAEEAGAAGKKAGRKSDAARKTDTAKRLGRKRSA